MKITREERVLNLISENTNTLDPNSINDLTKLTTMFDASSLANELGIDRSNVSRILNLMYKDEKLIKISGKPSLFFHKETLEQKFNLVFDKVLFNDYFMFLECIPGNAEKERFDEVCLGENYEINLIKGESVPKVSEEDSGEFEKIIGADFTLKAQMSLAKAAMMYPPRGLNTLLTGQTGVGKSTFAETMYKYGVSIGLIEKTSSFVVFNCADYAENPQLLMAQLFGYVRGAFSGADKEKKGIIDEAENGVLFLDEIHRLPPEGQEMLFLVMDKGFYRRLGEVESKRKANILIIAATTEDTDSSLLTTFKRRMPIHIELPELGKFSQQERAELVFHFFYAESVKTKKIIKVSRNALRACMHYDCPTNIGGLKSDIQLVCAKAYFSCISTANDHVDVRWAHLTEYMKKGLLNSQKVSSSNKDWLLDSGYTFDFRDLENKNIILEPVDKIQYENKYYANIVENLDKYSSMGLTNDEIRENIEKDLEEYFNAFHEKVQTKQLPKYNDLLSKIVDENIVSAVEMGLNSVSQIYGEKISEKLTCALALHINNLIERLSRGDTFKEEDLIDVKELYPIDYHASEKIINILEDELQITIPHNETMFIAMLLHTMATIKTKGSIKVLVICHGNGVATGIASVVNMLLGEEYIYAIDMPLDEKVENILTKAIRKVKEIDTGSGVLLLTDMGSLNDFDLLITEETGIAVIGIDKVTTILALEAGRKAYITPLSLGAFAEEIISFNQSLAVDKQLQTSLNAPLSRYADDKFMIALSSMLTFLDPFKAFECLKIVLESICNEFSLLLDNTILVKFIVHCSLVIERQITKTVLPCKDIDQYLTQRKEVMRKFKEIFSFAEETFGVEVHENELAHIIEIFDTHYNKII